MAPNMHFVDLHTGGTPTWEGLQSMPPARSSSPIACGHNARPMKIHETSTGQHNDARQRVRMECAFGHLTVGSMLNGPGLGHRTNQAGLPPGATMVDKLLPAVGFGDCANGSTNADDACDAGARDVTAPPKPVVTVRRRIRASATIP